MKITWYMDEGNAYLSEGRFFVAFPDRPQRPSTYTYAVVRDKLHGFNVVRVDFSASTPVEEREAIMQNMLLMAEIRYNDLTGKHNEQTV